MESDRFCFKDRWDRGELQKWSSSLNQQASQVMVDLRIISHYLPTRSLNPLQFAYQSRKSAETALHKLVSKL